MENSLNLMIHVNNHSQQKLSSFLRCSCQYRNNRPEKFCKKEFLKKFEIFKQLFYRTCPDGN